MTGAIKQSSAVVGCRDPGLRLHCHGAKRGGPWGQSRGLAIAAAEPWLSQLGISVIPRGTRGEVGGENDGSGGHFFRIWWINDLGTGKDSRMCGIACWVF